MLIILNLIMLVLHILIFAGLVPQSMVWGGQIKGQASLYIFEIVALVTTLLFIGIVSLKAGYISPGKWRKAAGIGCWLMFAYLVLNIAGNLASFNSLEKYIFTPVAFVMALLALRVALEKSSGS
ncbi:hypothetical protein [Paenibacillus tuaregi]|uniref:hypothetical protein n=1 Tax=Paenibacillus tuaregi TaxID=1816681 RepID=UPI0009EF5257|nr:hypothetical protein [Paenibacillus tuaregi]